MYMEVNPGGLQLPSVTLCPGFKNGVFVSVLTTDSYPHILKTRGRKSATEEEIQNWYKASTYNLDEGSSHSFFPTLNVSEWSETFFSCEVSLH